MHLRKILDCGAIVFLSMLVITSSILLVTFNTWFYKAEFSLHNVYESFPEEDIMVINEQVLSFLKGKQNSLPPHFFNEREQTHFEDVRIVLFIIKYLFLFSLVFVLIYFWQLQKKAGNRFITSASPVLKKSGFTILFVVGTLTLLVLINFSSSFALFHLFFFQEGTYSFDPRTENIVVLYPEPLFRDASLLIGGISLSLAVFLIGISAYVTQNKKLFKKGR